MFGGGDIDTLSDPRYSFRQLKEIIEERLVKQKGVFDAKAVSLAALRVAAETGDVRKALKVCRAALDFKIRDNKKLLAEGYRTLKRTEMLATGGAGASGDAGADRDVHSSASLGKTGKRPRKSLGRSDSYVSEMGDSTVEASVSETTISHANVNYMIPDHAIPLPPYANGFSGICTV